MLILKYPKAKHHVLVIKAEVSWVVSSNLDQVDVAGVTAVTSFPDTVLTSLSVWWKTHRA